MADRQAMRPELTVVHVRDPPSEQSELFGDTGVGNPRRSGAHRRALRTTSTARLHGFVIRSRTIWFIGTRRARQLPVQGLAVLHTAPKELRPRRHRRERVGLLREQTPERWMMPAERMASTVPVRSNAGAQPFRLGHELLAGHAFEVVVHVHFPLRFSATAARMSGLNACSSILSPSWKSMARRVLPSRLGVEETGRVLQRGALGEGCFHDIPVRLTRADDSGVRPHGCSRVRRLHPLPLLHDFGGRPA